MRYGKPKIQVSVQLPENTHNQLIEISKIKGKSKSSIIRDNVIQYCDYIVREDNLNIPNMGGTL
jgi:hypothetical protein